MIDEVKSFPVNMLVKIHSQNRQFAERNVRYLEGLFKTTNKLEDPERWLILQDKLGDAYKQLMQVAKNGKNNE